MAENDRAWIAVTDFLPEENKEYEVLTLDVDFAKGHYGTTWAEFKAPRYWHFTGRTPEQSMPRRTVVYWRDSDCPLDQRGRW